MKVKELKQAGIKRESIDNGYRVAPTYRYTYLNINLVIEVDKTESFGIKYYVMSINGKDVTNFKGVLCRWENMDDIQEDVYNIFIGGFPKKSYTTI